jgi:hypothetical protein
MLDRQGEEGSWMVASHRAAKREVPMQSKVVGVDEKV